MVSRPEVDSPKYEEFRFDYFSSDFKDHIVPILEQVMGSFRYFGISAGMNLSDIFVNFGGKDSSDLLRMYILNLLVWGPNRRESILGQIKKGDMIPIFEVSSSVKESLVNSQKLKIRAI